MNLTDELEKSFAAEPAHRPVAQQITAGRRLLRRRRALTGAAALAVVAVLGAGYAVVGGDDERATEPPIADQKDEQLTEKQLEKQLEMLRENAALLDEAKVVVTQDGELLTAPGVELLQTVPNPDGYGEPGKAYGVAFTFEGATRWALVDPNGGSWDDAFRSFPTFEYWLADQVALQTGEPLLELVRFGEGEELLPLPGVDLLQQTGDIDLGPNFAGPRDRTAVAEVRYDDQRWYVLARDIGGDIQYFPTAASVSKPTLEEFLPYAKTAYDNQEGLR